MSMEMELQLVDTLVHVAEIGAGLVLIYATWIGRKKFRLVIWKRGWYVLTLAGALLILKSVNAIIFHDMVTTQMKAMQALHLANAVVFLCFALGVFELADVASKIWREKP